MEPGNFKFQDNEEIDSWEPINPKLSDLDSQSSSNQDTFGVTHAGEVDTWKRVSDEAIRLMIVHRVLRLLDVWVISGLIVFIVYGNMWLLTTSGLLELLLRKIFGYYFRYPKK